MAKTYVDAVKYLIKSNFEIDGIVEKPDIVGAIFGQTEGLLGDELDLRELQKNGRIGRIEVETQVRGGKTAGTIVVPSSLDMVETSILAASLEVVDRVGPCDARITVSKIEDSRNLKRKQVLDRAKNLLKQLIATEIPESKELSELVRDEVKIAEITEFGEDNLPAGPTVASSNDVIFVEGRADVINLLRNGITNVVAVGGAKIGKTVTELGRRKEVTVFLDGDRGGDIVLRELLNATDIDFVARAPPGKEVEELTRKEIIKILRSRIPVEQVPMYAEAMKERQARGEAPPTTPAAPARTERAPERALPARPPMHPSPTTPPTRLERPLARPTALAQPMQPLPELAQAAPAPKPFAREPAREPEPPEAAALRAVLKELEGSLKARLFDVDARIIAEVPIREIMKTLGEASGVNAVVLDGIVTQRLIDLAEEKGVRLIAGIRSGNIARKPTGLKIVLSEA